MSSLAGHWSITRSAVEQIRRERAEDRITRKLRGARLPTQAITRDLIDLVTLGHLLSVAQKHHFMRRFDGESARDAYRGGVEWIRLRSGLAIRRLAARVRSAGSAVTPNPWRPLGDALHALQDSFAAGHARRGAALDDKAPGPIEDVLEFSLRDLAAHARADQAWRAPQGGGLSLHGRLAANASAALILLVLDAAGSRQAGDEGTRAAGAAAESAERDPAWDAFVDRWLRPSSALAGDGRDGARGSPPFALRVRTH